MPASETVIPEGAAAFEPLVPPSGPPPDETTAVGAGAAAVADAFGASAAPQPDYFVSSVEAEKRAAYRKGYEEGQRETLAKMSGRLDEQVERWRRQISEFTRTVDVHVESFLAEVEARAVEMAVAIARRILSHETAAAPERLVDRVGAALSLRPDAVRVTVRLNPADLVFVRKLAAPPEDGATATDGGNAGAGAPAAAGAPAGSSGTAPRRLEFVGDPRVQVGGFVVETPESVVDHTFEAQLERIEAELGALYEAPPGPTGSPERPESPESPGSGDETPESR